jgi:hypothetical protein
VSEHAIYYSANLVYVLAVLDATAEAAPGLSMPLAARG